MLQPVRRLDVLLLDRDGEVLGLLARLRDVLPGQYAFGLTGRGPDGLRLEPGPYRLRLVAWPAAGGSPTRRTVPSPWNSLWPPKPRSGALVSTLDCAPATHLRGEPLRDRATAAPARGGDLRHRPQPHQRPVEVQEVRLRGYSHADGRRLDHDLRRLSRHAPQHRARAVQGRHSLPPGHHPRRGAFAGDVDDLEVRTDGHPVRRRQGRRRLQSQADVRGRARAHDAPLHLGDHHGDRPGGTFRRPTWARARVGGGSSIPTR